MAHASQNAVPANTLASTPFTVRYEPLTTSKLLMIQTQQQINKTIMRHTNNENNTDTRMDESLEEHDDPEKFMKSCQKITLWKQQQNNILNDLIHQHPVWKTKAKHPPIIQ